MGGGDAILKAESVEHGLELVIVEGTGSIDDERALVLQTFFCQFVVVLMFSCLLKKDNNRIYFCNGL